MRGERAPLRIEARGVRAECDDREVRGPVRVGRRVLGDIGDRSASELMTPRHRIDFLDLAHDEVVNLKVMGESPHNFYPVCDGSTDNVVGVVASRELWRRHVSGESTSIREAMEPAASRSIDDWGGSRRVARRAAQPWPRV